MPDGMECYSMMSKNIGHTYYCSPLYTFKWNVNHFDDMRRLVGPLWRPAVLPRVLKFARFDDRQALATCVVSALIGWCPLATSQYWQGVSTLPKFFRRGGPRGPKVSHWNRGKHGHCTLFVKQRIIYVATLRFTRDCVQPCNHADHSGNSSILQIGAADQSNKQKRTMFASGNHGI